CPERLLASRACTARGRVEDPEAGGVQDRVESAEQPGGQEVLLLVCAGQRQVHEGEAQVEPVTERRQKLDGLERQRDALLGLPLKELHQGEVAERRTVAPPRTGGLEHRLRLPMPSLRAAQVPPEEARVSQPDEVHPLAPGRALRAEQLEAALEAVLG